jgi:hypothetical protein
MRTYPIPALLTSAMITIHAEYLKFRGKVISSYPVEEFCASKSRLSSSAIDMIQSQKVKNIHITFRAGTLYDSICRVVGEYLHLQSPVVFLTSGLSGFFIVVLPFLILGPDNSEFSIT